MKRLIIILFVWALVIFAWPKVSFAATALSFSLSNSSVAVNDNFTADIIAQSANVAFYSADLEISFNSGLINLNSADIAAASLLDCGTGDVILTNPYNAGTARVQVFREGCEPLAVNSPVILARLNFTAKGAGSAEIRVENLSYMASAILAESSVNKPSASVNVSAPDAQSPQLIINPVTPNPTPITPLTISGSAADNVAVEKITWSNSRGGSGQTEISGASWSISVPLETGDNIITVKAFDNAKNNAVKTVTVTYAPPQASVSLNPLAQSVKTGDGFSLTLRANDVVNMDNLLIDILFDSARARFDRAVISSDISAKNWKMDILDCLTPATGCKNFLFKSDQPSLINGSVDLATLYFTANAAGAVNFSYANNHLYDSSFKEINLSWNSAAATIAAAVPTSTTCASFTYSSYSACTQAGVQSRTILSRFPANCTGGNPETLTRTCIYAPQQPNNNTPTADAEKNKPATAPGGGVCGLTLDTCLAGGFYQVKDTVDNYRWYCLGPNNGPIADCLLSKKAVPPAGQKQSSPLAQAPVAGALAQNASSLSVKNQSLYDKFKGRIILKVEDKGKAYYISLASKTMYYLGRPQDAFSVMRNQAVGISNVNLSKIKLNLKYLSGLDSDQDGLPDDLERSIGTDPAKKDTDGDGVIDKTEILNNYSPLTKKPEKMVYNNLASKLQGKIVLQVENKGQAYYINPLDKQKYFLSRPADAFNVMRYLGLGISNANFNLLGK